MWDDGTDNLDDRVKELYGAKVVDGISDEVVTDHIAKIKHGNEDAQDWWLAPDYVQHTVCYKTDNCNIHKLWYVSKGAQVAETFVLNSTILHPTRTDCILNHAEQLL